MSTAYGDDQFVTKAKALNAIDFDKKLPSQPITEWLQDNLPSYELVWSEHITGCGEITGSPVDKERDMPLCAEVKIKDGANAAGYLYLFIATEKQGLLTDNMGVYFGHIEHHKKQYDIKRLSDILKIRD